MTDGPDTSREGWMISKVHGPVESLASEALNILAKRRSTGAAPVLDDLLEDLRKAVLDRRVDARGAVMERLRRRGIPATEVIDQYVPEIARRLGKQWVDDQLGFAEVTIGTSRLQSLVRELTVEQKIANAAPDAPVVAVAVVPEESHTLGAMVLTAQLRRLGISVRLILGPNQSDLHRNLRADRFDAVFISASNSGTLVHLEKFIKNLRWELGPDTPIVVGGPVLDAKLDVKSIPGVDFATSDLVEALRVCRLKISPHVAVVDGRES